MQRTTMEGTFLGSQHRNDQEFDLREWRLRARISRENTSSRRYSASYLRSFREDSSRSFRSNFTISSTASSPGYHLKDEIDPSTYSFTTALKALQARSGYVWECLSPEGFALNSKWNEAERYICNPLSGEVPMECLSAKTLSGRSFRSYMASRVTMSAPLVYSMQPRTRTSNFSNKVSVSASVKKDQLVKPQLLIQENHIRCKTRDVGIQSTPPPRDEGSTSSPSAASTPSIRERSIKRYEDTEDQDEDVQNSSSSVKSKVVKEVDVKVTREGEETREKSKGKATLKTSDKIETIQRRSIDKEDVQKKKKKKRGKRDPRCTCNDFTMRSLLASWRRLWAKRLQQEKSRVPPKLKKY